MTIKRFIGKTALVTGAASGIGLATATRLVSEGASVIMADINAEGVAKAAGLLADTHSHAHPVSVRSVAFDAGDPAGCRAMVDEAVDLADGRLDVLCNIAGIMDWGPLDAFTEARWERMLRINLSSLFHINQRAMPSLIRRRGNIVNMASAAGLMGIAYTTAYCVAKAGVIAMTKSLAVEFASAGVRVNAIAPGAVNTPMNGSVPLPEGIDLKLLERNWPKLGELLEAEDIAAGVAYLASEDGRNTTGIVLSIDGGQVAG